MDGGFEASSTFATANIVEKKRSTVRSGSGDKYLLVESANPYSAEAPRASSDYRAQSREKLIPIGRGSLGGGADTRQPTLPNVDGGAYGASFSTPAFMGSGPFNQARSGGGYGGYSYRR